MILTIEGYTYSTGDLCVRQILNNAEGQDTLAAAYLRMKAEGLLPLLFYQKQPDLTGFLTQMFAPGSLTMLCFSRLVQDVCGFGHVVKPQEIGPDLEKTECSMLFFRGHQKREETVPFSHLMIEMAFALRPPLDVILGCTPEKNPAAVRYITAVGFTRSKEPVESYTTWNGVPCGCYMSWLTRRRWEQISPFSD